MKKLMLLAALLAMLIVAAVPAIAQIGQESAQETESGDVDQSFTVSGEGSNGSQCAGIQGIANTGNAQNQTGLLQYASDSGDFEFDEVNPSITVEPETSTTCEQSVEQAAAASSF
jgi:hypothetical protein